MLREFTYPDITVVTDRDTIYSFLSARAQKNPDEPLAAYLKGKNRDWEYVTAAQMLDAVQKTARGLIALGVKKADTVLIYAHHTSGALLISPALPWALFLYRSMIQILPGR